MANSTECTLALTAEEAETVVPRAQWFASTLHCCPSCALRLAGANRSTLYTASDAALAAATGLPLPKQVDSSGVAPDAAAAAVCPTCLGALTCLPTTSSIPESSSGDRECSLRNTLLASRLAAGHEGASGFRLHVQLPPSLCGVRDHAAWFLAQAALARTAEGAAGAAPAEAAAAAAAAPPTLDPDGAAQTIQATGASPVVTATSSARPSTWPDPNPPQSVSLSQGGHKALPPRASSQVVPLKEALKWRLASRLPSVLNLPMLPPPAQAKPSSVSFNGGAAAYSAAAGAASANGDTLAAATIAYGEVTMAELNALDVCVEPAVGSGPFAIASATADGLLADLLDLASASEQHGSRGGGFGNGGKKRGRGGWNAGDNGKGGSGKGGNGKGGGKWAKGNDNGKGFWGKGSQGGAKGGKGQDEEEDNHITSTADVVAVNGGEKSAETDLAATATLDAAAAAATAAAAAATAATAAASMPNGESMNKRCEGLNDAGQRNLAAWLAAQIHLPPPLQASAPEGALDKSAPKVKSSTTSTTSTTTMAGTDPQLLPSADGGGGNVEATSALAWTCSWQRPPIFLGGRYRKLARDVPQSPWVIDGVRKGRGSVDECLTHAVAAAFGVPLVPVSATNCNAAACTTAADAYTQGMEEEDFADSSVARSEQDEGGATTSSGAHGASATATSTVECVKFHGAGREDIDVRMLGRGRPFILEVINPRTLKPLWEAAAAASKRATAVNQAALVSTALEPKTEAATASATVPRLLSLPGVESSINAPKGFNAQGDVEVEALHFVPRSVYEDVLAGAEEKTKTYRVVCWVSHPVTEAFVVQRLSAINDLALDQQTPLRVLHRRTSMTRGKMIHAIRVTKFLGPHWFCLDLDASAGTYIKEFIHGDLGRTRPSMADLLQPDTITATTAAADGGGTLDPPPLPRLRADILQLDVSGVHMTGVLA